MIKKIMTLYGMRCFWGGTIFSIIAVISILSCFWTPYDVNDIDIAMRFQGTSARHFLGTDYLGRDIFSLLMVGGRHSLMIAVLSLVIGLVFGGGLGVIAARYKGIAEEAVLRSNDIIFAFPIFLSAAMMVTLWGAGPAIAIFAIGIFNISIFTRLSRILAATLYVQPFIISARALGQSEYRILWNHILPNMSGPLIVQATIQLTTAILVDASLGYLGFSVPPSEPSWGKMLYESRTFVEIAPHMAIYPGCAIFILVVGLNIFGEGWRDKLDPAMRHLVGIVRH